MNTNDDEAAPQLDLDVLLAEATASVGESAELEADEGGPDDESGELPADEASTAADEDSDEIGDTDLAADDDGDGEEDDDEDLEDEFQESDEDDETDDDGDEGEAPTDPRILELETRLEALDQQAQALRQQNQQLMELARLGAVPRQQPQEQRDPEFDAAWKAAHVGGAEALEGYSPQVKKRVSELAQHLQEARATWALHPEKEYQTRFAPLVAAEIQRAIAPLIEAQQAKAIDSVLDPHRDFLKEHSELVSSLLPPTYGAPNPDDPQVMRQRLETAVALAKAKLAEGGLRKREQRVKTKDRQQDAKRRSRKRGSRKPRKGQPPAPKLRGTDGDDLLDFANRIASDPALLEQAERELRR